MPVGINKSLNGVGQASPTRTSPRKTSNPNSTSIHKLYPTPLSMSPSTASTISISTSSLPSVLGNGNTIGTLRFPPSFDPNHPSSSSRYPHLNSSNTPYSPYRPGEYGRSERGLASERTKIKIERKLFDDDDDIDNEDLEDRTLVDDHVQMKDLNTNKFLGENNIQSNGNNKMGSSPLAPAFQAKMVLRNGASIDLISWLRTNFHHVSPPHTVLTPCMPLNGIRHLLLERFPRAPEVEEISKAVLAAFPHSQWDYPTGTSSEPPNIRGLVWHGKDINDEDEMDEPIKPTLRSSHLSKANKISTSAMNNKQSSRSPTQSTLVSPISSSKRHLPDTPARSVLEEFAEIATLADKTPTLTAKSLPDTNSDELMNSTEYQLDEAVDVLSKGFSGRNLNTTMNNRKRHASQSPELGHKRRASTPDKLHGLLAAAEAVEGSPITSVLNHGHERERGHKRRRTIGGIGSARELISNNSPKQRNKNRLSRGTLSPPTTSRFNFLPQVNEDNIDYLVPLNDISTSNSVLEESLMKLDEEETISNTIPLSRKTPNSSSSTSHSQSSSNISQNLPLISSNSTSTTITNGQGPGRKVNELPTEGDAPGYDCKPPYPYHEMIRHAIENAPDCRLQLSQIYSSIADRFPFFKTLDEKKTAGWQNSIRHNLSLKKMFVRVNKPENVPDDSGGKGGWWTVQPGVPDEGRPGRKAKAKKAKADAEAGNGEIDGEGEVIEGDTSFDELQGIGINQDKNTNSINGNENGNGEINPNYDDTYKKDVINGMIGLQYQSQPQPQLQQQNIYHLPQTQDENQNHYYNYQQNGNQFGIDEKSIHQHTQTLNQNDNTQVSIHEIPLSQGI